MCSYQIDCVNGNVQTDAHRDAKLIQIPGEGGDRDRILVDPTDEGVGRDPVTKAAMNVSDIHVGSIITGPLLPEPVEVLAIVPMGDAVKLIGKGRKTGLVRDP